MSVLWIWYCTSHGDGAITKNYKKPDDPCKIGQICDCELIYKIDKFGNWIRKGEFKYMDINQYFSMCADGYSLKYLENLVTNYQNNH